MFHSGFGLLLCNELANMHTRSAATLKMSEDAPSFMGYTPKLCDLERKHFQKI